MTIQLLKNHDLGDGKIHRAGAILAVAETIGNDLVRAGIAKERTPPGPTEKKDDPA